MASPGAGSRGRPGRTTVPVSGSSVPASSRSRVDLPAPFSPISPIRWPGRGNEGHAVEHASGAERTDEVVSKQGPIRTCDATNGIGCSPAGQCLGRGRGSVSGSHPLQRTWGQTRPANGFAHSEADEYGALPKRWVRVDRRPPWVRFERGQTRWEDHGRRSAQSTGTERGTPTGRCRAGRRHAGRVVRDSFPLPWTRRRHIGRSSSSCAPDTATVRLPPPRKAMRLMDRLRPRDVPARQGHLVHGHVRGVPRRKAPGRLRLRQRAGVSPLN